MTISPRTDFDLDAEHLPEVLDELPLWSAPFGLMLLEKVVLKRNLVALDIGFGTGFPLTELAMRLGKSSLVLGIDPWESASKRAQKKIRLYGIENAFLIQGNAEHIPLAAASLDLIVSNNGLNNVTDLATVLQECVRVLKPGGQLVQTLNLDTTMIEFYTILETVLRERDLPRAILSMKAHIREKRKPLEEITGLLDESGFVTREVQKDTFWYRFVDGTALLNHFFIRLAFLTAWEKILPEQAREAILVETEKRMNAHAEKDGSFSLSVPYAVIDSRKREPTT
jgi:ubiquinone/menaquinone biosynthesis C-methylase UbiE